MVISKAHLHKAEEILWLAFLPAVFLSITAGQAIAALLILLRLLRGGKFRLMPGFTVPALIFLCWALTTALIADPRHPAGMLSKWWVILLAGLAWERGFAGGAPRLLAAVFLTAVAVFPLEIWNFFLGPEGRARSVSGGAPSLGSNLLMLSVVCLALLAAVRRARPRAVFALLLLVFLAGLVMSVNRAALLGAVVGLSLIAVQRLPALVPAAVLALGTLLAVAPDSHFSWRLRGIVRPDTSPTSLERYRMYESGLRMVRARPLTGFATRANFQDNYAATYRSPNSLEDRPGHVHNSTIQAAVLHGVPGLGLLLWLLVIVWRNLWRASRTASRGDEWREGISAALIPLFLAVLINAQFDFVPAEGQRALMFWTLVGLLPGYLFSKVKR